MHACGGCNSFQWWKDGLREGKGYTRVLLSGAVRWCAVLDYLID